MSVEIKEEKKKREYQTWKSQPPPWQVGRDGFSLISVKRDPEGWADIKTYLPINYELVELFLKSEKIVKGWWNGQAWEGFRLKDEDEVLYWR